MALQIASNASDCKASTPNRPAYNGGQFGAGLDAVREQVLVCGFGRFHFVGRLNAALVSIGDSKRERLSAH